MTFLGIEQSLTNRRWVGPDSAADRLAEGLAPDAPLVLPIRAEGAEEPRITLTRPALADAMNVHVLIMGPEKREALERAQNLDATEAPIRAFLDNATVHWAE